MAFWSQTWNAEVTCMLPVATYEQKVTSTSNWFCKKKNTLAGGIQVLLPHRAKGKPETHNKQTLVQRVLVAGLVQSVQTCSWTCTALIRKASLDWSTFTSTVTISDVLWNVRFSFCFSCTKMKYMKHKDREILCNQPALVFNHQRFICHFPRVCQSSIIEGLNRMAQFLNGPSSQ